MTQQQGDRQNSFMENTIAVGVQGCLRAQLVSRRERPDGQSGGAGEKQSSVS